LSAFELNCSGFIFKRCFGKLREKGVFKLTLPSTPKRYHLNGLKLKTLAPSVGTSSLNPRPGELVPVYPSLNPRPRELVPVYPIVPHRLEI